MIGSETTQRRRTPAAPLPQAEAAKGTLRAIKLETEPVQTTGEPRKGRRGSTAPEWDTGRGQAPDESAADGDPRMSRWPGEGGADRGGAAKGEMTAGD